MDERLALTVRNLRNIEGVQQFGRNAAERGVLTQELQDALNARAGELLTTEVAARVGVVPAHLTSAQMKVLRVVAEYAAIKANEGTNANRTIAQVKRLGLLGAAEAAVVRSRPTGGYETLMQAGRQDITYEQIIIDHAAEFSPQALWYARNTLGLGNELSRPPASSQASDLGEAAVAIPSGEVRTENPDCYWLFICNPRKWAIDRFLRSGSDSDTWGVRPADKGKFAPGQLALIRVGVDRRSSAELAGASRLEPGIYAVCQVESEPFEAAGASSDYWSDEAKREPGWPTVRVRYLHNLADRPLLVERLRREAPTISAYVLNGFQASSMPIPGKDFRRVLQLTGMSEDDIPAPPDCNVPLARLAALEERYRRASPEVRLRVSRSVERGQMGNLAKKVNGFRCQICEALGLGAFSFRKLNGEHYVEAHHVMPVAKGEVGSLGASNIMTLCANHHRHMHFGEVTVRLDPTNFNVTLDNTEVQIARLVCDAAATEGLT